MVVVVVRSVSIMGMVVAGGFVTGTITGGRVVTVGGAVVEVVTSSVLVVVGSSTTTAVSVTDVAGAVSMVTTTESVVPGVEVSPESSAVRTLAEAGARLWELADGRPLSQIVDAVVDEYVVERAVATSDLCELLRDLDARGLLAPDGAP